MSEITPSVAQQERDRSKSQHIAALAAELLDDIELNRLPAEALLLKTMRLARFYGASDEIRNWLTFELTGYNSTDPVSLQYMGLMGRWTDYKAQLGYWAPLAEIDAAITNLKDRLKILRIPDVNYSVSSANPHEVVTGLSGMSAATAAVSQVLQEQRAVTIQLGTMSGIRGRFLAYLHAFVAPVYYEKLFSGATQEVFERYKGQVDRLIAERAGDVLQKFPAVYDRLAEGDPEAVSQALTTCRRIIDVFADAIYSPADGEVVFNGQSYAVGAQHHLNRIKLYVMQRVTSTSRRKRLKQAIENLYDRVCAGVHDAVTAEEAKALFLETYLLAGEILMLPDLPAAPAPAAAGNGAQVAGISAAPVSPAPNS